MKYLFLRDNYPTRALVRSFNQLRAVARVQGVADEEVVGGETEWAKRVVRDEVVRAAHRLEARFLSARGRVSLRPGGEQRVVVVAGRLVCLTSHGAQYVRMGVG